MKYKDPKTAAKKSRKISFIDLIIILAVIAGMSFFYKFNVHRALEMQKIMKNSQEEKTVVATALEIGEGQVVFFDSKNKKKLEISVIIAENAYQQKKGFMFTDNIPENQGMLFVYEDELQRFFWMKNTEIPLDIIFIDATYKIVKIHRYTKPLSENIYPSGLPAQFVVEVRAGFSKKNSLMIGDRISWEMF